MTGTVWDTIRWKRSHSRESGNDIDLQVTWHLPAVIPSADFMILRLTTLHENARSALECGPAMRDRLEFRAKSPSADGYRTPRCLRHNHFHGSEESRSVLGPTRVQGRLGPGWKKEQSEIPRCARNDSSLDLAQMTPLLNAALNSEFTIHYCGPTGPARFPRLT